MGEIFERPAPASALEWTGERLTSSVSGQIEIEHLHRYFLARELCRGLDVLDVASGEGYGTAILAQTAKSAVGVELSPEAARHAAASYRVPNLRFLEGDARALPLPDACVDAVVSFETIEHFYEQDAFLAEVKRVLRPGGRLIVSSPDRDVYSPPGQAANPYHARELARDEFEALLGRYFSHVALLGQRPMIGSALLAREQAGLAPLTFERRGESRFEASPGLPRAIYLVAIASDEEHVAAPSSVFIERDDVGDVLNRAAAEGAVRAQLASALAGGQAAEASVAATRVELERAVQEAGQQASTYAAQLEAASQQIRALDERLQRQEREWQAQIEAARQEADGRLTEAARAHDAILGRERQTHEAERVRCRAEHDDALAQCRAEHEAELARLGRVVEAAKAEAQTACDEAAAAAQQRDLARAGLRRAGVFAENRWHARVQELEAKLRELELGHHERDRRHLEVEQEMENWRVRYHVLRGRVELLLRRSGIVPASRIVPRPVRQWALDLIRRRTRT